jgi:hypothetical protein
LALLRNIAAKHAGLSDRLCASPPAFSLLPGAHGGRSLAWVVTVIPQMLLVGSAGQQPVVTDAVEAPWRQVHQARLVSALRIQSPSMTKMIGRSVFVRSPGDVARRVTAPLLMRRQCEMKVAP